MTLALLEALGQWGPGWSASTPTWGGVPASAGGVLPAALPDCADMQLLAQDARVHEP